MTETKNLNGMDDVGDFPKSDENRTKDGRKSGWW